MTEQAATPLAPAELRWRCDPDALGFETTADVTPLGAMVGQDRGVGAIAFALDVADGGYNLFVAGPSGTGRSTTVRAQVERVAAGRCAPSDRCYVHNFVDPDRPIAIELPAGTGPGLARDLGRFVDRARQEIPRVFEGEEYRRRRQEVIDGLAERRDALLKEVAEFAAGLRFGIEVTPMGIASGPLEDGKPLSREAFEALADERKADIAARADRVKEKVDATLPNIRTAEREAHAALHAIDREVALFAVGHLLDELRSSYAALRAVLAHLDAVQEDLIDHLDDYRTSEPGPLPNALFGATPSWERYGANILVTHDPSAGAPVVLEPIPTHANLLGRIDYRSSFGAIRTDFSLLKAGALHRANGGFLIVQARDLLVSPFSYEALKRALRDRELRIESPAEQLSLYPTAGLKPAPIPLDVKVILIGDAQTYALLHRLDEDFTKLFKVKSEFGPAMDLEAASIRSYAGFVSKSARARGLLPFGKDAVGAIVEAGARAAEHQGRLSTRFDEIEEIVVEADHWARAAASGLVRAEHVGRAIDERERRASLVEDEIQRLIDEGTLAIDTRAKIVGQVNGLAVLDFGDHAFARPSRITARTGMGGEGVVDIEREAKLSGPTHSKGVLILSGYLIGQYARERPLVLSARLTFEQTYGGVEGDSASAAELFAILSSLTDLAIDQGIAVTGSLDQLGLVQAIGAVTEKIEGHYKVCLSQGLTGTQGVIIPRANVRHLMLRREVVDAVAAGRFHVWAIGTVDEGIALLTGVPAGTRGPDGTFPQETVHGRVEARLASFAKRLAEYARGGGPPGSGPAAT